MFMLESSHRGSILGQVILLELIKTRLEAELFGKQIVQLTRHSWRLFDTSLPENEQLLTILEAKDYGN